MKVRQFVMLLLVLALALPAFAQEQRGAIEGVVKDSSGGVLPGVTVEAKSAGGAVIAAVTDSKGVFRFPAVAPGKYQVQASLTGFKPARVENLEVLLGQIKTVDFSLSIGSLTEEVQVTAEAPLVDTKQSARATSITAEQLDSLPKGRDFMSVVTQAPGANNETKSNGVMIDGATTSENRYIVDGAETSDIVSGGSGKSVIADFVAEVQVKSSGYTAEYGGATGGVINVVTKSGTNNWHGNVLFNWEGSALQGGRTPTLRLSPTDSNVAEYITYAKDGYSRSEPGASIGGPLLKDKTWFFLAYQPTFRTYERTVTSLANGQVVSATQKAPYQYFSGNNTSQIGSKLHTRVAYNNSWGKTDGALPALDGTDPTNVNYAYGNTNPNWSLSGQADWIAKPNFFVGARVGYYTADIHSFGVSNDIQYISVYSNTGMAGIPPQYQMITGQTSVPTNSATNRDQQQRLSFQVDGTWYGNLAGQHTIKGGLQVDRLANSVFLGNQANVVRLYWGKSYSGQKGDYGYYRIRSNGQDPRKGFITTGDVATNNYGLFIQDAWTVSSKLTVNLGLRTENEKVPPFVNGTGIPASAINFNFADKLAPRLGFAYDIKGDGKWKAYGSWGIFYDIFKMNLARGSFGGEKWLEYCYTLDTYDYKSLISNTSCPSNTAACSGKLILGPYDYRAVSLGSDAIDPNLKPMKSMETSFGVEHQLSAVTAVSARYVHKQLLRAVDDTGSYNDTGEIYVIANPGEGMTSLACSTCNPTVPLPKARRDYDSVELAFQKNMSKNWYLRASYMWSRLYGNYSGLDQTDENGRTAPNTGRLYDYPTMSFDQSGNDVEGPLATDRPNQFKAQFIYMLPFGTTFGINGYVASGVPKTREMQTVAASGYPLFYQGRGSDGRMPTYSQADLMVSHDFKLSGAKKIQISLNVLNLFNQSTATNYYSLWSASGGYVTFSESDFYAHKLNFDTLAAQQKVAKDPRFMMDSGYQTPIQARIGLKFLF
jgi:hypothetical protein